MGLYIPHLLMEQKSWILTIKEHTSRGLNFYKPQMSHWQLDAVMNPDGLARNISSLKLKMSPMAPKPHDCKYITKHLELGTVGEKEQMILREQRDSQ